MVTFRLSAFADEYSPNVDEQIEGLLANRIDLIEPRGIDGEGIASISLEKARELRKKLDAAGIGISAIGSPIGKIGITDEFAPHLDTLRHQIEVAKILGTKRIRMFSFYIPEGKDPADYRDEVLSRMEQMLTIAEAEGIEFCHENEKGIYGDTPERCHDLLTHFGGRLKGVFDPANFLNVGSVPFPNAYELLKSHIDYFHIKDADGLTICPAGLGKGRIGDMLAAIRNDFDGEIVLTAEPHLFAFIGLENLENTNEKIVKPYTDSKEAFRVAIQAIRALIG